MRFENIKVITDSHGFLQKKEIQFKEAYCFLEPTDIQTAEEFEEYLIRNKTPYVLAQCETTLPDPTRYVRGYAIFVEVSKELGTIAAIGARHQAIRAIVKDTDLAA